MEYFFSTLHFAVEAIWFYLPILFGNLAIHSTWARLGLDIPADLYWKHQGMRILGPSRSVGGVPFFLFTAIFIAALQGRALEGLYLGIGAWVGTTTNTFLKRRLGIARGQHFIPFDQVDFLLGGTLFYMSAFALKLEIFLTALFVCGGMHLFVNLALRPYWESLLSRSNDTESQ